ncbi:MAG: hypothetical protein WAW02_01985 [Sideroxyarcus sp.]
MSRMHSITLPVALFCSALAISACTTKSQEAAVVEPAPAPAAVEAAPEAAPAPAPVEPVAAPAPVVTQEAPAAQEPAPAVTVTPLAPAAATPGFLEKYWMWLVGIVVAVVAFLLMKKKD